MNDHHQQHKDEGTVRRRQLLLYFVFPLLLFFSIALFTQLPLGLSLWLLLGLGVVLFLIGLFQNARTGVQQRTCTLRFHQQDQFREQFLPLMQRIGFHIEAKNDWYYLLSPAPQDHIHLGFFRFPSRRWAQLILEVFENTATLTGSSFTITAVQKMIMYDLEQQTQSEITLPY